MMKKLINFFKKLFRCDASCLKCKNETCKCEPEIPAEHIRVVEEPVVKEEGYQVEFQAAEPVATQDADVKPIKKKRTPRKKKSETSKK